MLVLKFNHYYFILLLCSIYGSTALSQTTDWSVLNNSGLLIHAISADSDNEGNLYITGDYKGEVLFSSSKDSGATYHNYISENGQQPFLIKYDSLGNLSRDFKFQSSSSNNIYTVTVKVLSTGKIAWVIRVDGRYSIIDKNGKEFPFQGRGQSIMVLLSPSGDVLSQTALPFDYCREITELKDGRLLLFGKEKNSRKQEVHLLDLLTFQSEQLFPDMTDIFSVSVSDTKVYLLTVKFTRQQYGEDAAEIRLYSASIDALEEKPELLFAKNQSGGGFARPSLISKNDHVDVILSFTIRKGGTFSFDSMSLTPKEDYLMLLKLDSKGVIKAELSMKTTVNGYYNTSLVDDTHGGYYLSTPVLDEIKLMDADSSILVPKHSSFINELVLFKLDEDLNFQWNYNLGGTASNSHQSFIIPDKKGFYFVTDLLDFVTLDGVYHELDWRAGLLLGRIKIK
jgi:hypothetical protein